MNAEHTSLPILRSFSARRSMTGQVLSGEDFPTESDEIQ